MKTICAVFMSFGLLFSSAQAFEPITGLNVLTKKQESFAPKSAKNHLLLVFLSAKCPCSQSHENLLRQMSQDFPELQFVGIHSNADENATMTEEHFKQAALPFPVIQDSRSQLANRFGALKTPHVYILNQEGDLLYQGGVTDSHVGPTAKKQYLREVLTDLHEGKSPRFKTKRSLGCYIERVES